VVVLSNTGGLDPRGVSAPLAAALVRRLLGLPDEAIRTDIPPRPDTWGEICGYYSPDRGPVTILFTRATISAGAEVVVSGRHLMLKPLHPVPAIRRGMRLHPDDPEDPVLFRIQFPEYGFDLRVAFRAEPGSRRDGYAAPHGCVRVPEAPRGTQPETMGQRWAPDRRDRDRHPPALVKERCGAGAMRTTTTELWRMGAVELAETISSRQASSQEVVDA
jgi:hypothetical protein